MGLYSPRVALSNLIQADAIVGWFFSSYRLKWTQAKQYQAFETKPCQFAEAPEEQLLASIIILPSPKKKRLASKTDWQAWKNLGTLKTSPCPFWIKSGPLLFVRIGLVSQHQTWPKPFLLGFPGLETQALQIYGYLATVTLTKLSPFSCLFSIRIFTNILDWP